MRLRITGKVDEAELNKRFINPLLRVAITDPPPDWTPIDRLDELWMYEGWYEKVSSGGILAGECR